MGRYVLYCLSVYSNGSVSSNPRKGIRNYVARNNLRVMKKGDLAFFYRSNCKEPGIVGTMEIVQEHSPDCEFPLPSNLPPIVIFLGAFSAFLICAPAC